MDPNPTYDLHSRVQLFGSIEVALYFYNGQTCAGAKLGGFVARPDFLMACVKLESSVCARALPYGDTLPVDIQRFSFRAVASFYALLLAILVKRYISARPDKENLLLSYLVVVDARQFRENNVPGTAVSTNLIDLARRAMDLTLVYILPP